MVQENDNQKEIIEAMKNELMRLNNQMESSMVRRLKKLSNNGLIIIFEVCRQFANYLLPANPMASIETPKTMLNSNQKVVQPVLSVKTFAY